ncbi:MAG: hypothetical protein R3288_03285 [Woeseiaceae bacterium]|nr:hypothetical protein [Woeseiaceae bacterium]
MSSYAFILTIIAIGCATAVISEYLKGRRNARKDDPKIEAALAELDALEERVRVLERIVTENKFDLKREIDRL